MQRSTCAVFIATSLDGRIARADGGLDWLDAAQGSGEDYGYAAFFGSVDALVMGRRTYEKVLTFGAWPYAGKRCIVLTRTPRASLHGEEFSSEAPSALVERLQREGVRRVYVDGGEVIRSFLRAGLIDELTLSVLPIVLGDGIPLFADGLPEQRLSLEATTPFPSGLVQLRYRAPAAA